MPIISKIKRTIELETSPNFLFFADLYAKAPKTIVTPAIPVGLGFATPAIIEIIPKQRAMVEPMCFFIFPSLTPFMGFLPAIISDSHTRLNQHISQVLSIDNHISRNPKILASFHVL